MKFSNNKVSTKKTNSDDKIFELYMYASKLKKNKNDGIV